MLHLAFFGTYHGFTIYFYVVFLLFLGLYGFGHLLSVAEVGIRSSPPPPHCVFARYLLHVRIIVGLTSLAYNAFGIDIVKLYVKLVLTCHCPCSIGSP